MPAHRPVLRHEEAGRIALASMSDALDGLDRLLQSRPALRKLVRYSAASIVGVISSQVALLICFVGFDMDAVPANLIACVAGGVPNYSINRAWTFDKRGKNSLIREVIPFWSMAIAGLILSTIAVAWADNRFDGNAFAVAAANIGSFGTLWIAKFFVLDRVLFAPLAQSIEESPTME